MSIVGYHAIVTMHNAAWGDESGSTVTFKLPTEEDSRNPFHAYTKRRSGKAGTRFHMVVNEVDGQAIYNDEVMLAGWNDSQQNGHTAKFWIAADAMGHPFEGISRKTDLAIALAELDDDNEPIDPKMRDRVEQQGIKPSQRLSVACAAICRNEMFWQWCRENDYTLAGNHIVDEESAKLWFYLMCGIDSRASLDDPERDVAIKKFDEIRKAFASTQENPF